ncbi:MAG: hypothetical protein WCA46_06075, partial [Actinocatenispora sp.]
MDPPDVADPPGTDGSDEADLERWVASLRALDTGPREGDPWTVGQRSVDLRPAGSATAAPAAFVARPTSPEHRPDPPVTDPPVTDPPVTDPPVTDPPDPSVTDPPVTDPPDPSVTDPAVISSAVGGPVGGPVGGADGGGWRARTARLLGIRHALLDPGRRGLRALAVVALVAL